MSSGIYTMKLRSVGNPDFGQYAPVSNPETVTGSTLAEMRAHCERYIEFWDLGGGNWVGPVVMQGKKVVGHFSYNGRLWEGRPGRWDASAKEILIADTAKSVSL
jgi:hypothetical protein